MSIAQYIAKYAPSSDGNNPQAYANIVAQMTGTNVNTPIKNVDTQKLAMAIMQHENGAIYKELVNRGIVTQN